jgi:hypothetical protein
MNEQEFENAYLAAMERDGRNPIMIEMPLASLALIVAGLQLALRHPHLRGRVRDGIQTFVEQTIANVATKYPLAARGMERGNDRDLDVSSGEDR